MGTDVELRVTFVCLGNICRSPMAAAVLERTLADDPALAGRVAVDSAGTGSWHIGEPAHPMTRQVLGSRGYGTVHRARRFEPDELATTEVVVAMDQANAADLRAMAAEPSAAERVVLARSFDPGAGPDAEVPDPYGADEASFGATLDLIEELVPGLVQHLRRRLAT